MVETAITIILTIKYLCSGLERGVDDFVRAEVALIGGRRTDAVRVVGGSGNTYINLDKDLYLR